MAETLDELLAGYDGEGEPVYDTDGAAAERELSSDSEAESNAGMVLTQDDPVSAFLALRCLTLPAMAGGGGLWQQQ